MPKRKASPRRTAKPQPTRLAQIPPLHEQLSGTTPLCDGRQRGFQCAHYHLEVTPRLQEMRDGTGKERTGFYARTRTCDLPSPSGGAQALDRDLRVYCTKYKPSKVPYNHAIEEGNISPGRSAPPAFPHLDPATAVSNALALADAGIPAAIASGRPMIAEGGEPARETSFNGAPVDSTVTVGDREFAVHAWFHQDRGWLANIHALGISGRGATRVEAEEDAVKRALPHCQATPAPDALY